MIDAPRIHELEIQFRFIYVAKEGSLVSFSTWHKGTLREFCFSLSLSLFAKQHACFNDDSFFVAGAFYAFSLATPIELIDFIGCGVLLFDTKRQRACIIYRYYVSGVSKRIEIIVYPLLFSFVIYHFIHLSHV